MIYIPSWYSRSWILMSSWSYPATKVLPPPVAKGRFGRKVSIWQSWLCKVEFHCTLRGQPEQFLNFVKMQPSCSSCPFYSWDKKLFVLFLWHPPVTKLYSLNFIFWLSVQGLSDSLCCSCFFLLYFPFLPSPQDSICKWPCPLDFPPSFSFLNLPCYRHLSN